MSLVTVLLGYVGLIGLREMRSYLQWEYYVKVPQCLRSLHQFVQRKKL